MNTYRPIPFVRFIIPLILGIICYEIWSIPNLTYILLFLIPLYLVSHFKIIPFIEKGHRYIAFFLLFFIGYSSISFKDERNKNDYFGHYLKENKNILKGKINNMPSPNELVSFRINVEAILHEEKWKNVSGYLEVKLNRDTLSTHLEYGDEILFSTWINPAPPPANPKAFDYSKYLHFQNIHYTSFIQEGDWKLVAKNKGSPFYHYSYNIRKKAISSLKKHLTGANEFAVGSALLLGYKDEITEDVKLAYAGTGAMHVLAVSGLHVGILASVVQFLLGFIRRRELHYKILKVSIAIIVIWGFAFITGASPSVLRAATMFSFLTVGNIINRSNNIYNTLASSAFLLLLLNPYLIFSPGFQLSYLAVIGIVFFYPWINKSWYVKNKIGKYFWSLISVSLAAQITTLPISLYYFDQFPTYFIFSGIVVIPAAAFVMYTGMLLLFFEMILPFLADIFGIFLHSIIWCMNAFIFILEKFPLSLIEYIHFNGFQVFLSYISIAILMFFLTKKNKRSLWFFFGFLILILMIQNIRKIAISQKDEIVFYHSKQPLIDYFHKGKRITIASEELTEKSERFASKGYRTFMNKSNIHPEKYNESLFFKNGSFLYIADQTYYILNKDYFDIRSMNKIKVDGIIIRNNVFVNLEALAEEFDFSFILFDGTNKKHKTTFLEKKCKEKNIPVHHTPFIKNLN